MDPFNETNADETIVANLLLNAGDVRTDTDDVDGPDESLVGGQSSVVLGTVDGDWDLNAIKIDVDDITLGASPDDGSGTGAGGHSGSYSDDVKVTYSLAGGLGAPAAGETWSSRAAGGSSCGANPGEGLVEEWSGLVSGNRLGFDALSEDRLDDDVALLLDDLIAESAWLEEPVESFLLWQPDLPAQPLAGSDLPGGSPSPQQGAPLRLASPEEYPWEVDSMTVLAGLDVPQLDGRELMFG